MIWHLKFLNFLKISRDGGERVIPPDSQGDRRLGPPHLLRSYRLQGRHHAPATCLVFNFEKAVYVLTPRFPVSKMDKVARLLKVIPVDAFS